jgi:hypothetical protein
VTCAVHKNTTFNGCTGCAANSEDEKRKQALAALAPEFKAIVVSPNGSKRIEDVRLAFDRLLREVGPLVANGRCNAQLRNRLEEACMWAVKGVGLSEPNPFALAPEEAERLAKAIR